MPMPNRELAVRCEHGCKRAALIWDSGSVGSELNVKRGEAGNPSESNGAEERRRTSLTWRR